MLHMPKRVKRLCFSEWVHQQDEVAARVQSPMDVDSTQPEILAPLEIVTQGCVMCFEDMNPDMIGCNSCLRKVHWKCIGFDKKLSQQVLRYYCPDCRRREPNLQNSWKLRKVVNPVEVKTKHELNHEVEAILDHSRENGKRKFLIHWKGCCSDLYSTWEPEEHFAECYETLQAYCEKVKIPYSKIEGTCGVDLTIDDVHFNYDNWIKPSDIVRGFHHFWKQERHCINDKIDVEVWDGDLKDRDTIYIVPWAAHAYVVLHYATRQIGYIADGANLFASENQVREDLRILFSQKITFLSRRFSAQTGVDHCGSSAIIIALC